MNRSKYFEVIAAPALLEEVKNEGQKKTLADIFGKLKRGIDGLEYQKTARYGCWN